MKRVIFAVIVACATLCGCHKDSELESKLKGVLADATQRYETLASSLEQSGESYPYAYAGGEMLPAEGEKLWACGYLPGCLWQLAQWNDDDELRETANVLTHRLDDKLKSDNKQHLAMIADAAHYNANKQMPSQKLQDAIYLISRSMNYGFAVVYRAEPNADGVPEWYRSMSVESLPLMGFLYDSDWSKNVVQHAKVAIEQQTREDGAMLESVVYNVFEGKVVEPYSLHGAGAESAWSRGQAMALYGYVMLYARTSDAEFLSQAEQLAGYVMKNLPADGVPNWDFDSQDVQKDASAAAIMASAFVELYKQTQSEEYLQVAERQLAALCSAEYLATKDECGGLMLKHGVGNRMTGDAVDASLIYADYYFIDAIIRYLNR